MLSTLSTAYAATSLLTLAMTAFAHLSHAAPKSTHLHLRGLNAMTYEGCFSSSEPMTDQGAYEFQTSGYCQPICVGKSQAVMGLTGGSNCWCGDELPPSDSKVDDSKCSTPCNGFGADDCGGTGFWSVYLTGTTTDTVPNYDGSSSSSAAASSAASSTPSSTSTPTTTSASAADTPSVITSVAPGTTLIVTESPSANTGAEATGSSLAPTKDQKSGGPDVAGIAAGVVVGVLALIAICLGVFFFLRHKRRKDNEKEYTRTTQVSSFIHQKPPQTAQSNLSDSRLDPEAMRARRTSIGSIADNQDYSRRILRVANPGN